MALPKQAASAVRHHHRRERHVWILTGDLPEEQSWESCLRYRQTLSDATQLLGLGRLAGTRHADLAEANQNFTHGVSVPGQDCCASGKALLILGPAVGKPNAEVWCLQGVLELCEGRTVGDDVGISSNKMKALGYHFKEKMPTRLRQCSLAE